MTSHLMGDPTLEEEKCLFPHSETIRILLLWDVLNRAWSKITYSKKEICEKKTLMQLGWLDGQDINGMISNTKCELMELAKSPISLCVKGTMQITPAKNQDLWCSQPSFSIQRKSETSDFSGSLRTNCSIFSNWCTRKMPRMSRPENRGIVQDIPRLKFKFPSSNDMKWHKWLSKSIYINISRYCIYQLYVFYTQNVF